jgi:hypothetical protein
MADYGYADNVAAILLGGNDPPVTQKVNLGTIANCYAGRLLTREDTDYDRKVCTAMTAPTGWLGYELTSPQYRPAALTTIYEVNDKAVEHKGSGFAIKAKLTKGCSVKKGEDVMNWADGEVAGPVEVMAGGLALGIPFGVGATTDPNDTSIDLPANMLVRDIVIEVETLSSGETMDVGFDNAAESGDLDGLADGVSLTTAVKVYPDATITGTTDMYYDACTRGVLLADYDAGAGTGDQGIYHPKPYLTDGTIKSVNYVKATHNVGTGIIWLVLESEGLQIVGKSDQTVDATTTASNMAVLSSI